VPPLSQQARDKIRKKLTGRIGGNLGTHASEATKLKMSVAAKKRGPMSEGQKRKISESLKKTLSSLEVRKKMSDIAKKTCSDPKIRKKYSDAQKKRCASLAEKNLRSERLKNRIFTEEHRKNLSLSEQGEKNHRYGKKESEEIKLKRIESRLGGFWYGNVNYPEVKYCERWTDNLRERVRSYFRYRCFECGIQQTYKKLQVHHVHYNKKTCCDGSPSDLVPLCDSCHGKTCHNRNFWESHFVKKLYSLNPEGKCFFTKEEMKIYGKK
jgi:hypothetical protein